MAEQNAYDKYLPLFLLGGGGVVLLIAFSAQKAGASIGLAPPENLGQLAQINIQAAQTQNAFTLAQQQEKDQFYVSKLTLANQYNEQMANTQATLDLGTAQISSNSQIAQLNAKTSEDLAKIQSAAMVQGYQYQLQAAQDASKAAEQIANTQAANQTTQAQAQAGAQKTVSFWNFLGNIGKAIIGLFGG